MRGGASVGETELSWLLLGKCPWAGGVGVSIIGVLVTGPGGRWWVRLGLCEGPVRVLQAVSFTGGWLNTYLHRTSWVEVGRNDACTFVWPCVSSARGCDGFMETAGHP